jgi:putative ABC transport system permease protein
MRRGIRRRLRSVLHRSRVERELDLELQFHLDMLAAQKARGGLPPAAAERAARQAFGAVAGIKDDVRDVWLGRRIEAAIEDVRYGVRTLHAAPGFAFAIILTIALAVGINTAIFATAYALLLRPLPFDAPEQLVVLRHGTASPDRSAFSAGELEDYRRTPGLDMLAELHTMWFILLSPPGQPGERVPERVSTGVVSPNYFPMLGVRAGLGRLLTEADDRTGAPAAILLTHEYWQRAFHGDPSVVGRVFEMNDRPHTVVGVLAPFPQYAQAVDVYMPTSACPFRSNPATIAQRRARMGQAIGRAAGGVSLESLQESLAGVAARLEQRDPGTYADPGGPYVAAASLLAAEMRQELRPTLLLLAAAAALVLLIACVSVGNLTLTRFTRRWRELQLRSALGATRRRLASQLLAENVSAVGAGVLLGLLLAQLALRVLTEYVQRGTSLPVDQGLTIGAVICAAVVSTVLLSVAAAVPLFVRRSGEGTSGAAAGRLRGGLVAGQVALSSVLMIAATLAVRSMLHLQGIDTGFTTIGVQTMRVDLNFSKYRERRSIAMFWQEVERRLAALPGVVGVGGTGVVPLDGQQLDSSIYSVEGRAGEAGSEDALALTPRANLRVASPGYFEALGQRVLKGRVFGRGDTRDGQLVVVINDLLARRWWPGASAVGHSLRIGGMQPALVVGVVENARQRLDEPPGEEIYFPLFQSSQLSTRWLVRSSLPAAELQERAGAVVAGMDPQQPVDDFRSLESFRDDRLLPSRVAASVVGLFCVLALVITATGIAGVVGYAVQQRRREFGVRLALGAPRTRVLGMVLGQGLSLVALGLFAGACASLPLLPLIQALPADSARFDPLALGLAAVVLLTVAAAACLVPAVRAARVDPLVVLRCE